MPKKERFGKFVLLEQAGASGLGTEYRAAKLAAGASLERLVSLIRLSPALSAQAAFVKALMDQAKATSLLQSPNVLRLLAIGRVESAYYLAYEHYDGKSLGVLFEKSSREGFPLATDHALLIASKVCAALEYAHSKKGELGRHLHGLVSPDAVVITYDGDAKLRGFGAWAAGIREAGGITPREQAYLAPEQLAGGPASAAGDVYAVGALLFEALTGRPFRSADGTVADVAGRLAEARLVAAPDAEGLPKAMLAVLARALAPTPAERFTDMTELRKAVDGLLFGGEFNPTTFNLAFFMQSLFRDEIEREANAIAEEASASYAEYAPGEARPAPKPAPTGSASAPAASARAASAATAGTPPASRPPEPVPAAETPAVPHGLSPREAAASLTFHKPERQAGSPAVVIGGIAAVVAAAAGWYFLAGPGARRAPAPPPTLSAQATAALARVKELEEQLKRFEREKAEAESQAADEAKRKIEAQAASRGQAVDPAALQKAQEEARRRATQEQEKRQQEERRRIEEEQRAAEARLAEERRRAEAAAAAAAAAATPAPTTTLPATTLAPEPPPPTTLAPAPAPTPAAAVAAEVKPGALVELDAPGVIPPVVERQVPLQYPAFAFQQRIQGVVELSVLVDEKGDVLETKIVKGAVGGGLNQAALDSVKRRKYRPATKDGVPVKVYLPVIVRFEISK